MKQFLLMMMAVVLVGCQIPSDSKKLDLSRTVYIYNDEALKKTAELKNITKLNLVGSYVTNEGLEEIAQLQNLTELSLVDTEILNLEEVAKLKNLTKLQVSFASGSITERLREIAKLQNLTK